MELSKFTPCNHKMLEFGSPLLPYAVIRLQKVHRIPHRQINANPYEHNLLSDSQILLMVAAVIDLCLGGCNERILLAFVGRIWEVGV